MEESFNSKCVVKLRVPAQYLGKDATKEQVESITTYKNIAKGISETGCGVVILPAVTDSEGKYLFDLEVIKV